MNDQIPIAKPMLGEPEIAATRRVIESGWVTQGPEVAAFEAEFAAYVGAKYACAVSNCTTALHLALLGVGCASGHDVITVSHSFIATANAILYCGANPIFIDIEANGFNMDVSAIEAAITRDTHAILCVHQMGMPCDINAIIEVAERHGLPVIEDAACAFGSEFKHEGRWQRIGSPRGAVACFSFHPRKVATTGDGGMLITNDPELDRRFRLWRQHGMSVSDTVRHGSRQVVHESYSEIGFNYRMTDIQAALGREQVRRMPDMIPARRRIARLYSERLGAIKGIGLPVEPAYARSNWQSYCIRLPLGCEQREVMQKLLDRGISTRRGIMNAHLEKPYLDPDQSIASSLVRSEKAQAECIMLPIFAQMTDAEFERVVLEVTNVLESVEAAVVA
ncbi:DegT/DnrJ/EryC1/StrS family aminotransferase [Devosia sp. Leaf64]|uniref:DegT/DnrJ/EryC1/StrS family aminotransferase n=1 Tax=Devosia sp. Leaf64 TaxID=1736229 RepID=UPI0007153B95|nr:DegT/DnrJ/EryC1/StrS family aminotransferase [Devosia sp. Leaf64]KQN74638.1 aminotransferase DegT [Devosia sp. Leaf64]